MAKRYWRIYTLDNKGNKKYWRKMSCGTTKDYRGAYIYDFGEIRNLFSYFSDIKSRLRSECVGTEIPLYNGDKTDDDL